MKSKQAKATEQQRPPQEEARQVPEAGAERLDHSEGNNTPFARLRRRVLKPIEEVIYPRLNQVVDRLGYTSSVILLLIVAGGSSLAVRWFRNPDEANHAITVIRYYWEARRPIPPRDPGVTEIIQDLTNLLKEDISPGKRNSDFGFGDWTEAQMVIGLQEKDAFDRQEMAEWFRREAGSCYCWRASPKDREHIGATAWVLLAFARLHAKPAQKEIEFLLKNQKRPGWWPIYPAADDSRNASSYATSLATWALAELLNQNLIADNQNKDVKDAIQRGRGWLLNNALPGNPGRWKDYPNNSYGKESIGISGMVLHVLHKTSATPLETNERKWMASLPAELPNPKAGSSSGAAVVLINGAAGDPTHYFDLPWLIIGIVDTYRYGTLSERAQAARLIHQIPALRTTIQIDLKDMPWLAAETLIALRHLQGEDMI